MKTSVIFAKGSNGAFGLGNGLCWHLPADLARFKALTKGKAIIMGRNTWASLPVGNRPLPGRLNIVITSSKVLKSVPERNLFFVNNYHTAKRVAINYKASEAFIIGGSGIIEQYQGHATNAYVTEVDYSGDFDVAAPALLPDWQEVSVESHSDAERSYRFINYQRHL